MNVAPYPFAAIVGQADLCLALILNAIDPLIGGVLIRGEKGTGKSTAVRGLGNLIPGIEVVVGCPFNCDPGDPDPDCPEGPHPLDGPSALRHTPLVELPVGASTERVTGSLDIEAALTEGRRRFEPGLLAAAHRGMLYVDEVNLLGDHLVDLLLDAAALGVNYVERDSVSVKHRSRFLLVGTMNPEEGELRPQLLDRFGITVEIVGNSDLSERAEVVRRRLAYEADPDEFGDAWGRHDESIAQQITEARHLLRSVRLSEEMLEAIVRVCAAFEVDGLRADIVCAKTASALAAWEGSAEVRLDDVRRAALLALPHRRRRGPFELPGMDEEQLDKALAGDEEPDPNPPSFPPPRSNGGSQDHAANGPDLTSQRDMQGAGHAQQANAHEEGSGSDDSVAPEEVHLPGSLIPPVLFEVAGKGAGALGRRSRALSDQGGPVTDRKREEDSHDLSIPATIRAAAPFQASRRSSGRGLTLEPDDLRVHVREGREGNLILFVVDASGSMGAQRRMVATKGAILSLLLDAYQRRDRVGMVAFRGEAAQLLLPPTSSVHLASKRLTELPTGGRTPLAAGLQCAAEVLVNESMRDPNRRPLLVLVTDGRANAGGSDPLGSALQAAGALGAMRTPGLVVDTEDSAVRLGVASDIAEAVGARCLRLEELAAAPLATAIRTVAGIPRRRGAA